MGVTAFFYATEGDADRVEAALRSVWPDEIGKLTAAPRDEGSALESIYYAEDGVVLALWQDGKHTCFAESELVLANQDALARLSTMTGTVVAVCIGDQGGSYAFDLYRQGRRVRSLSDGADPVGAPLPEEAGIDLSDFGEAQIERIWSAFGLAPYADGVVPFRVYR